MVDAAPLAAALLVPVALAGLVAFAASLDAALAGASPGAPARGAARLLLRQRRTTVAPDALLWRLGAGGPLVVAALMLVVVPLGHWTVADLDVGVVWFNAMDVQLWALVWMAGWGPNALLGLAGGYRFLAQALAYELPLMFALICPAVAAQSLSLADIAAAQQPLWFVVYMPVALAAFLVGVLGFAMWGPFAHPLHRDVAGGAAGELSGPDRLLLEAGRLALLAAGAAFGAAVFLGAGDGPLLPAWLWSVLKTLALLAALVAARRRLPTLRMERFTEVGWLVLLPATVAQTLLVTLLVLFGVIG